MPVIRKLRLIPALLAMSRRCAVTVVIVGVIVLVGWITDMANLQSVVAGLPTMKVTTAGCLVLSGFSLLAWQQQLRVGPAGSGALRSAAMGFAALVMVVALATLTQYVLAWDSGLDRLFFRSDPSTDLAPAGSMAMGTALLFLLCGMSLLLFSGNRRAIGWAQGGALVSLLIALLVLLSYVLGADLTRVAPLSNMAVHTAFAFAVLALGIMALRGDEAWFSVFMQDTTSARNGRRYFLGTLLVLPVVAALGVVGERVLDWYGPDFATALWTIAGIAALASLNWHATNSGNTADRKVANIQRLLGTLSGINTLIVRVRDKNTLFDEACRIASEVGQFPLVWIATVDAAQQTAQMQAIAGSSANRLSPLMPRMLRLGPDAVGPEGLVQQVCASKAPFVFNDIDVSQVSNLNERRRRQEIVGAGIRSLVALPLVLDGKVVGVFALHAERTGFFNAAEMNLLAELAGDIAFAIGHIDKAAELSYLAYYDPLTGLPNRSLFMERLGRQLQLSSPASGGVMVLLGNLRRFRFINETYGRHVGDELLRLVAIRMRDTMDFPENLSRVIGDSFASFMPGASLARVSHRVQDVFARVLKEPFRVGDHDLVVDASMGVAVFPGDGLDGETLIGNAATALRRAQDTGERCVFYEAAMNARAGEAVKLEFKLRRAIELGQLELHYQPKVDAVRRGIHSVEALMRWRDPESGLVLPGQFIPLMEEIGLIGQAGAWAMRQAVADVVRLRAMGLKVPRCAVNVSAIQLRDPGFVRTVLDELAGFGDDDVTLDIEITESLLMEDLLQTIQVLQTLRGVGMEIAVDDFGTGYSSLAYLVQLPINALKIDRAFVKDLEDGRQSAMVVASIISLAHGLNLQVIAEGVETEAQAVQLRAMGCDLLQGYLFSRPIPFDQLVTMLSAAE